MEVTQGGYLFRYGDENDPKFLHKVSTLETEFAKYCGASHALATSSGTSALVWLMVGLVPDGESISIQPMPRLKQQRNSFVKFVNNYEKRQNR